MKHIKSILFACAVTLSSAIAAISAEFKLGDLVITDPVIPATIAAAPVAAGYLKVKNNGSTEDRLVAVVSDFSKKQQIHTMKMIDGVMKMRPLPDGITIPAGGEIVLEKGGDHLMFMQLNEQMKTDAKHEVTLRFEKAGEITINMAVIGKGHGDHGSHGDHSSHGEHKSHDHSDQDHKSHDH